MQSNSLNNALFISLFTTVADPAAGADAVIPIPATAQAELVLVTFTLVTDANAANRSATISFLSGATDIPLGSSAFPHTASLTFNYIAHQNPGFNAPGAIDVLFIPLPNLRLFQTSETIRLTIVNIQAADQISDIIAYWKIWRGAPS